jgi:1-aminocyclopropane-1-carboxylate deaminase/D-cysteine desulfhydrase-like pyridoxal-dependent ACC family enzyme
VNSDQFKTQINALIQIPTPATRISFAMADTRGVDVYVKRDDLTHREVSGNKWRKLKYNLIRAREQGFSTLATVGGAYSNHISAVAAAGKMFGFNTIGIIRGNRIGEQTPTLRKAQADGMALHFISRAEYRERDSETFVARWRNKLGEIYYLPEGGTNALAMSGCAEIVAELATQMPAGYDFICTAVGSGGTLAGLSSAAADGQRVVGIPVVNDASLQNKISRLLAQSNRNNWRLLYGYIFGDYGKVTPELLDFMRNFHGGTGVPLEPVYTGKLFYAVYDLIEQRYFSRGTRIVIVHTGGLQGNAGFSDRYDVTAWS